MPSTTLRGDAVANILSKFLPSQASNGFQVRNSIEALCRIQASDGIKARNSFGAYVESNVRRHKREFMLHLTINHQQRVKTHPTPDTCHKTLISILWGSGACGNDHRQRRIGANVRNYPPPKIAALNLDVTAWWQCNGT